MRHCLLVSVVCMTSMVASIHAQSPDRMVGAGVELARVQPNDNRAAGGRMMGGVRELHLVAGLAAWRPDLDVDSAVTVQAFSEADGVPRIPGPLLRATEGTQIRMVVTNDVADSVLVVYGLRAGTLADDTIHVAPATSREVRYSAGAPGTYMYWGTTSGSEEVAARTGRDAQLTGAIIIDAAGAVPDPGERIFVMTVIDIFPDTTKPPPHEDIWELAINGLSWPHTERLEYGVDETVRWRWLNGSHLPHPMHLHGFHFRVVAKGSGVEDVRIAATDVRDVVTEFMVPGSTFAMEWTPTRSGNWLFHCHMAPHISPFPARPDSMRSHDVHDVAQHALQGMAGLVLGIRTVARTASGDSAPGSIAAPAPGAVAAPGSVAAPAAGSVVAPKRRLRLFVQQAPPAAAPDLRAFGYALQQDAEPRPDSVSVPGTPIVLTRGETTGITVINRSEEQTTVHWHGMELESLFDGVAGWSGADSNLAPLIAPGDSFMVSFTPPRAGTYIYHTHMDEGTQLANGSYGALIVLEPGERYDPETDLLFIAGRAVDNGINRQAINGRHEPPPLTLRAGTRYRLRIINILPAAPVEVELIAEGRSPAWRPISKDGADLPPSQRVEGPARIQRMGVGESYDFEWTPTGSFDAYLVMRIPPPAPGALTMRQPVHVR